MPFLSTRRAAGSFLFAAFVNVATGQFWRVTGGVGAWATYNPATSLPAEFTFAFSESPAGSGRFQIAAPPASFTDAAKVAAGADVAVWLIVTGTATITNADIVAGGRSYARRWNRGTSELDDPADYRANEAKSEAASAASLAAGLDLAVRNIAGSVGIEGGIETKALDGTITQVFNLPGGGTLTKVSAISGASRVLTVTIEEP